MRTSIDTIEYILHHLQNVPRFSSRAMFGEYALYADGKVVALVCNDSLYVKILPASKPLEGECEIDAPYPGAKPHYVISEEQVRNLTELPEILFAISASLPVKKKKIIKI